MNGFLRLAPVCTTTPRLVNGREVTSVCSPRILVDRKGVAPSTRCLQGSVATTVHAGPSLVEPRGIEPPFPRCERGTLPLSYGPEFLRAIVKQRLAHSFRYVGVRAPGTEVTPLVSPRMFVEAMVDKECRPSRLRPGGTDGVEP